MSDAIVKRKAQWRKALRTRRDNEAAIQNHASQTLIGHYPMDFAAPEGKNIAGYSAIGSEMDPQALMVHLEKLGASLAWPRILSDTQMDFAYLAPDSQMIRTKFGTLQPDDKAKTCQPDIILCPLLGFDISGNRLGYGGGYYDRALSRMKAEGHCFITLGLAYQVQMVDRLPAEPTDFRLNAVMTEQGIISFPPKRSK